MRPFGEDLLKYLFTIDEDIEFGLCLNQERRICIGLMFMLFNVKKLKQFKGDKKFHIFDRSFYQSKGRIIDYQKVVG
jgi:hypothetical protein